MTTIKLKRTRTPPVSLAHLVAILIVAFSVFLIVDFGIRAANLFQAHQRAAAVDMQLTQQMQLREKLQQRLEYVQSDAYVEEVARTQLKWSRPGETVVVIVSPPPAESAVPDSGPQPAPAPVSDPSSWLNWWFLFFDGPPPQIF
jgi:cell division protein FtsB